MPAYNTFATAQMNATGIVFCAEGQQLIATHTIQDAYDQPKPEFWLWALFHTNRAVCNALIATMMQNLWDAGADQLCRGLNVNNHVGLINWHKGARAAQSYHARAKARGNPDHAQHTTSAHVALAYGARVIEDDLADLDAKDQAFMQMQFVDAYIAAMNDLTGEPEKDIKAALKPWFLTQVTLNEFSANGTYT